MIQPPLDSRPILRAGECSINQLGEPLHLLVERPPVARVDRQASNGSNAAEHACDDRDIAFGAPTDLIKGLGQQGSKGRNGGDHAQGIALVAVLTCSCPAGSHAA